MYESIPFDKYKFLSTQIDMDLNYLKDSYNLAREHPDNDYLVSELCQNYSNMTQNLKNFERYLQTIPVLERPISGRRSKDMEEIERYLSAVKAYLTERSYEM